MTRVAQLVSLAAYLDPVPSRGQVPHSWRVARSKRDHCSRGYVPVCVLAKLFAMARKNQKVDEALGKAADAILDMLAETPAAKARQARAEIKALALKSYRSQIAEKLHD